MTYPPLPKEAQNKFDEMAEQYTALIHSQKYSAAFSIVMELYKLLIGWQKEYNKRFHKGYALHNMGYALHLLGDNTAAFEYFMLAYIEDLLSADRIEDADLTPAGVTLIKGYKYDAMFLLLLKNIVIGLREKGQYPKDPKEILKKTQIAYEQRIQKDAKDVLGLITVKPPPEKFHVRTFRDFQSEWMDRVFIGGSGGLISELNSIRKIVNEIGYDPIVAVEFEMPDGMTVYRKCLLLLHSCKYAVFDLTEQKGQLLEVERSTDYHVKTLLVWQSSKDSTITQMLQDSLHERRFEYKVYENEEELKDAISNFLPKKNSHC